MDAKQMMVFYSTQSEVSDPRSQRLLFKDLPADLPGLVKVVQSTIIHVYWSDRMGAQISRERKDEEMNLRTAENILRLAVCGKSVRWKRESLVPAEIILFCCPPYSARKVSLPVRVVDSALTSNRIILKTTGCVNGGTKTNSAG